MNMNREKIIPWMDDQLFKLLVKKYPWDSMRRNLSGDRNSWYYYIPKELVKKEYITSNVYIMFDPYISDDSEDNWASCRIIEWILSECCELDLQQYYDLFKLNIRYKDERPKCSNPECNAPLIFKYLRGGYGSHAVEGTNRNYCSQSCCTYHRNLLNEIGFSRTNSTIFMSKGNPYDICQFYIAKRSDGVLKYGITMDIKGRINLEESIHNRTYDLYEIMYTSTRIDIAELEDRVKSHFGYSETVNIKDYELLRNVVLSEINNSARKKILILAPHPDDSIISFGGLISKEVNKGNIVYDVCFTMGGPCSNVSSEVRLNEHNIALDLLHVYDHRYIYKDLDGRLDTIPNCELTRIIDNLISELKPDKVYCAAMSEHSDHIALSNAFRGAARLRSGWQPKLFAFGTYMFSDQLYTKVDGGKIFQPLSESDFNNKLEAFRKYKSQYKPSPSPLGEDGLKIMAQYYGMLCGAEYAELYYQLRYICEY